jgi:hypothetical protein
MSTDQTTITCSDLFLGTKGKQNNKVTTSDFVKYAEELQELHDAAVKFHLLKANNPGKSVQHGEGDQTVVVNLAQAVTASEIAFKRGLKRLSKMRIVKKKKKEGEENSKRKNTLTESFIRIEGPLKTFFEKADFGFVDPVGGKGAKLADKIANAVTKGVMLRASFTLLMSIYTNYHGLKHDTKKKYVVPDAPLTLAVVTSPAYWTVDNDGKLVKNDAKKGPSTMTLIREAENDKIDTENDKLAEGEKKKTLDHWSTTKGVPTIQNPTNFQSIVRYNSTSQKNDAKLEEFIKNNKTAIVAEFETIKATKALYEKVAPKLSSVELIAK